MARASHPLRWLTPLVLVSGAGLAAGGVWGLWRNVQAAESEASLRAEQAALALAGDLRQVLADPRILELAAEHERFAVASFSLAVPEEVEWLHEPRQFDFQLEAPALAVALAGDAERAEWLGEGGDVAALLSEALAIEGLEPAARLCLLHRLAWNRLRADSDETRVLVEELLSLWSEAPGEVRAGSLLLASRTLTEVPELFPVWIGRLQSGRARAVLERLATDATTLERWRDPALLERCERHRLRIQSRRELLRAVEPRLRLSGDLSGRSGTVEGAGRPDRGWSLAVGERLLLFFSAGEGQGSGALVDPAALLDQLRSAGETGEEGSLAASILWNASVVYGEDSSGDALPVAPLVAVVPQPGSPRSAGAALQLTVVLVALCICLVAGVLLALRVLRRETALVRARTQFLTSVTHELKTPLSSIRLFAEMLLSGRSLGEDRRRHYYRWLASESGRLSVLIENVLDIGRIERGERAYDRRKTSIGEVVDAALDVFAPLAERDGLTVTADLEARDDDVFVDRAAMVQALINLLENSRKYALEGGRVRLSGGVQGQNYRIILRDFGPGIPDAELETVFEQFQRGSRHHSGAEPGVGLGLALARRIVADHGGRLTAVTPEEGEPGAEFHLVVPLASDSAVTPPATREEVKS